MLASQTTWDPVGRFRTCDFLRHEFPVPLYPVRLRLWDHHLPDDSALSLDKETRAGLIQRLANGFQLTEGQIEDAIATARHLARQRDPDHHLLTSDDLYEGCRRQSGRRLISFARRVEPRPEISFSDLVLPPANQQQLLELRNRIRYRSDVLSGAGFEQRLTLGKGLITLFTGTSGTGKTMAAQLLAGEQGVDLYKIDMSAVVSKYVGETEKNLSRVFAEAEDSNAIIFFDEADALFGKRGKVEEARDRWANMEVNYLLQRVEEYAGVVVLATNLRQNIDEAFIRRIHIIVDFPFPEAEARYSIWFGLFPPGVRRPPKDQLVKLTKFSLAGGSIQNIVIDATYRARARKDFDKNGLLWVRLRDLVLGTAREYQKLGRPLTKGEFGEEFFEWIEDGILLATPDPDTRHRIWVEAFPPKVGRPTNRELQDLATQFPLGEFSTRAIVREAIERATPEPPNNGATPVTVTQRDLVLAIARRYRGLELPVTPEVFGKDFYAWVEEAGPTLLLKTSIEHSYRFWRGMFAANIARPTDSELHALAERFPFERSAIQEIVLNATLQADHEHSVEAGKTKVTIRHLVLAIAAEYLQQGKPITREEFGEEYTGWVEEWQALLAAP